MKKSKAEEKDELIATTKTAVLDRVARNKANKKAAKKGETSKSKTAMSGTGQAGFSDTMDYKLQDKITRDSLGKKLLE